MLDKNDPLVLIIGVTAACVGGLVGALKIVLDYMSKSRTAAAAAAPVVIKEALSGELPREHWEAIFSELQSSVDAVKAIMHDFTLTREQQWERLNDELKSIGNKLQRIGNSIIIMRTKLNAGVPEEEDV